MVEVVETNWIGYGAVLLLGLLIAWWLFARASRSAPRERRPDVLDEGAAPAQRNQSLIDAPPAAMVVPPTSAEGMGGLGEVMAMGVASAPTGAESAERAQAPVAEDDRPADADRTRAAETSATAEADDLHRLKGVGPKLVAALHGLGVTRYAQIAGWSEADIDRIDARLGPFAGRIRRDDWVGQARLLASGDIAAYEERFGKV